MSARTGFNPMCRLRVLLKKKKCRAAVVRNIERNPLRAEIVDNRVNFGGEWFVRMLEEVLPDDEATGQAGGQWGISPYFPINHIVC